MDVCKVVGQAVSTAKDDGLHGTKLMIVRAADANPYLVLAGLLHAGLDGLARDLPLPEFTAGDAYVDTTAPRLPANLQDALDAFEQSACYRGAFGDMFVDTFVTMGRHEVGLFARQVTEWERERYREVV